MGYTTQSLSSLFLKRDEKGLKKTRHGANQWVQKRDRPVSHTTRRSRARPDGEVVSKSFFRGVEIRTEREREREREREGGREKEGTLVLDAPDRRPPLVHIGWRISVDTD